MHARHLLTDVHVAGTHFVWQGPGIEYVWYPDAGK
jgi:hypothetical protein